MRLGAETDWFDVQISESFVLRVTDQLLRLNCHKLWVEPCSEHLAVERLVPAVMIVFVCVFKFDCCGVGFNLSDVEKHFVDLLVGVGVRTAQIVGLPNSFFHFETVHDCQCHIGDVNRLYLRVHSVNLPVHAVEHFHLHAPFRGDGWILME